MTMHCEGRPYPDSDLLLCKKAKLCDTARSWLLHPKHHSLWPTIQCRSPTVYPPPHLAGRDDKGRCDEKQPRQQASSPCYLVRLSWTAKATLSVRRSALELIELAPPSLQR